MHRKNMHSKSIFLLALLFQMGVLRLTSNIATTTFVSGMSIANQDIERYFKAINASHQSLSLNEERSAIDAFTYAFLEYSSTDAHIDVTFPEEKARYGEGKIMNIRGKLVHVTDAEDIIDDTACNTNILGTRGEQIPSVDIPWIALVRRGRCTFEDKVRNVFTKGARGVIIYNDKPVMNLEKMQIKGKSRNITAVITYQDIGLEMARIVNQGIELYAFISEGRSGIRPISSFNRTSVLFVSISFIVLMIISLVWLIFYYIQRFRYLQSKDQQSRHLCSVTKKAIMNIPIKTGKISNEKDSDSDSCAICIETFKSIDPIRILPCKHEFHKSCIDPWLIEHRTCPMCKLDVLKFYGYVVGNQIHNSPSPHRLQPNPGSSTDVVSDNILPVIVVAVNFPSDTLDASNSHDFNQQQQLNIFGICSGAESNSQIKSHNRINSCCHCNGRFSTLTENYNNNTNLMLLKGSNTFCNAAGDCIHQINDISCLASIARATPSENASPMKSSSRQVTDV